MPPAGFETTIPAREWPKTHALDCAATGIGEFLHQVAKNYGFISGTNRIIVFVKAVCVGFEYHDKHKHTFSG